MKKKNLKPMIISALLAVGFGATSVGTSFALFTDHADTTINVTAGKVDVSSALTVEAVSSLNSGDTGNVVANDKLSATLSQGGEVKVNDNGTVSIDRMIPGDRVVLKMANTNASNVAIKHRVTTSSNSFVFDRNTKVADTSNYKLGEKLTVKFYTDPDCAAAHLVAKPEKWSSPVNPSADPLSTYYIEVAFPDGDNGEIKFGAQNTDNIYQNKAADFAFSLEAVQGNAVTANTANGFADTYPEVIDNVTYTVHEIDTPKQFSAIYSYQVPNNEKPIYRLTSDINFNGANPCADTSFVFRGILDGDGHKIKNAVIEGEGEYIGLFSKYNEDTIVENITLDNCKIVNGGYAGLFFGGSYYAYKGYKPEDHAQTSTLTFENVTVNSNCSVDGSKNIGALVGNPRGYKNINFKNITNNANVYGTSTNVGGLFGSATYTLNMSFENVVNNGDVVSTERIGGLGGTLAQGTATFKNVQMNGNVTALSNTPKAGYFLYEAGSFNMIENSGNSMNGKLYANSDTNVNKTSSAVATGAGYVEKTFETISLAESEKGEIDITNSLPTAAKFKVSYSLAAYAGTVKTVDNVKEYEILNTANYTLADSFTTKAALKESFGFPRKVGYFLDESVQKFTTNVDQKYVIDGNPFFFRMNAANVNNYTCDYPFKDTNGNWCAVTNASDTNHRSIVLNPIWGQITKTILVMDANNVVLAYLFQASGGANISTEARNMHDDKYVVNADYSEYDYKNNNI